MRAFDRAEDVNFGKVSFPKLKGHVKLTLHNCRTGKNEVHEGENIVTNAVRDIFANNYLGGIDYSKNMALWSKWFGGVLLYKQAHPEDGNGDIDPDDYYPRNDLTNQLIAHAGDTAPQDYADDTRRGSPNTVVRVITENSIKQGWEWGSTQGNGIISSLSLCHADTGNAGLGSGSNAFAAFSPFEMIQGSQLSASNLSIRSTDNLYARYDDNHGIWFHIGEPSQYNSGRQSSFATKKLTVSIIRLPYLKAGLFETFHGRDITYARTFTVETTGANMYMQPAYHFDITNKYLWVFYNNTSTAGTSGGDYWWSGTWSKNTVSYFVVDCVNETIVSEGTITTDTNNLLPLSYVMTVGAGYANTDRTQNCQICKDGNYVYLPTGTMDANWSNDGNSCHQTGYIKIDITNQSDQTAISFDASQNGLRSTIKNGGLIICSGKVVNGATGYSCNSQLAYTSQLNYFANVWAYQDLAKPSKLILPIGASTSSGTVARYIAASKLLNTTMFNLDSAVEKNASKSMTVEYTLTEV